jgi:F-type H+-transporting ATPase subunit gamma
VAQRRELEARLASIKGLRGVIHSMRSLAAVNIRRAGEALTTTREYADLVAELLRAVLPMLPHGYEWGRARGAAAIFVFASDQGLCGQFNERIVDFALEEAARLGPDTRLMVIGTRGAALLEERGLTPALRESAPRTLAGIEGAMRRLAGRLLESYLAGPGTLHLAYNRYDSAGAFTPVREQILPPPLQLLSGGAGPPPTPPRIYTSPELLAEQLIEEYLFTELYRALGESLASENGARLRAMDEAVHNIDKTIDLLTLQWRVSRQEEITSELLDVVGGVEALRRR